MTIKLGAWTAAGLFTLIAIAWLWWANQQWLDIAEVTASTLEMPAGRLLGWMLTVIVSGFAFGLAIGSARHQQIRGRASILLTLSVIPFAVLFFFFSQVTFAWFPDIPTALFEFIFNDTTLTAFALLFGLLLAAMIGKGPPADPEEGATPDTE
jgi:hypothetical protein